MYILFYDSRIGDYFVCHKESFNGTKSTSRYRTTIMEGIETLLEEEVKKLRAKRQIMKANTVVVMFPSDLEGHELENNWVEGYDPTLEENQDKYMEDFWKWCEANCTYKEETEVGFEAYTIPY